MTLRKPKPVTQYVTCRKCGDLVPKDKGCQCEDRR